MSKTPQVIEKLIEKFDRNLDEYRNPKFNETLIRVEFVNPFWKALGWDVDNEVGHSFRFRDVIHEDEVRVGQSTKAPDYSFRIGGTRVFFVETKKPAVDLKHDPAPAFQLRRYAYSAKLPVSILTDFEEFIVYDCKLKPTITDKPHVGRMIYYTFQEYMDQWDKIHEIFSKEAVMQGNLDRFIEKKEGKKPRAEIDRDFLNDLDKWRVLLARNIALRNTDLTERELNYAIQLTIDRLIFLRMCEDRGIETRNTLQVLLNGERTYPRLVEIYYQADERYNSGLFHFQKEKDITTLPDTLTPSLKIDDKVLKDVIGELYYPKCPYEFSILPVEVLGNAYEQFLGKVIRLTKGHHAKIEEKPEVRKAGGVYYTPKYIVDYIVKNTVGKILEDKTPKEVSDLRILDPACGSGSFLLGAYQYLLEWHLSNYRDEFERTHQIPTMLPVKGQRKRKSDPEVMFQGMGEEWYLTTTEKKRILLKNIYGVDIDANAVEVTRLSLLLKVLENETSETIHSQLKLWHERALPDLGCNIKCGNSLIGPDFYENQHKAIFKEEEILRINVFDWKGQFIEIFESGGFNAVIGNPPYGALFTNDEKKYIKQKYKSYKNRYDSYIYFMEKGIELLKTEGLLSYITPELWLRLDIGDNIRKTFAFNADLHEVFIHGENVFRDAIVNTCTFIVKNGDGSQKVKIKSELSEWVLTINQWLKTDRLKIDYRLGPFCRKIIDKINKKSIRLSDCGEAIQGITPYDKYRGQSEKIIKERAYHFDHKHDETCGKWLAGKDIKRYFQTWSGEWLSYGEWLAAARSTEFFQDHRLLFREIPGKNKRIQATYVENGIYYHGHSITPFKIQNEKYSPYYLLGIINSRLLSWYGNLILPNFGKEVFPKLNPKDIKALPIRIIDLANTDEIAKHKCIVKLVEQMLRLQKKMHNANDPLIREKFHQQIEYTDYEIDRMVYELYDLNDEEIRIVEKSV